MTQLKKKISKKKKLEELQSLQLNYEDTKKE